MRNTARGIPHSAPKILLTSISLSNHIFLVLKLKESRMIHSVQEHITSHLAALPSEIKHLTVGLALDPLGRHEVALAGGSSTRNSYVSVKLRISTSALCSMMWSRDSMRQSMRITTCIKLFPCSGLWCFTITSLLSFHFPLNCSHTGPSPKNLNAFHGLSLSCNKHMHRSRLPQN